MFRLPEYKTLIQNAETYLKFLTLLDRKLDRYSWSAPITTSELNTFVRDECKKLGLDEIKVTEILCETLGIKAKSPPKLYKKISDLQSSGNYSPPMLEIEINRLISDIKEFRRREKNYKFQK